MDTGVGNYAIDPDTWKTIGAKTEAAIKTVPSSFICSIGNIAENRLTYTAESYTFWFMYLAPHLL